MTPRDVSPFTYSCSPAAASGVALASAAWLTEIAQVPSNAPLAPSSLESVRFMKTSMVANSTRHLRRHVCPDYSRKPHSHVEATRLMSCQTCDYAIGNH